MSVHAWYASFPLLLLYIEMACGPDSGCLNRATFMECDPESCPCGMDRCRNQAFQGHQYAPLELFWTGREKGFGLRTLRDLPVGAFVIEYVGEVIKQGEFEARTAKSSSSSGTPHYFTMNAGPDVIIDATRRGNLARFINHSCSPNSVTQKWLVQGATRIGIFTLRPVKSGEEITFDYKFIRFGYHPLALICRQTAQICVCGEPNCKGFIGMVRSASGHLKKSGISESLQTEEDLETLLRLLPIAEDANVQKELIESISQTESYALLRNFIGRDGIRMLYGLLALHPDAVISAFERLPIRFITTIPTELLEDPRIPSSLHARWSALPASSQSGPVKRRPFDEAEARARVTDFFESRILCTDTSMSAWEPHSAPMLFEAAASAVTIPNSPRKRPHSPTKEANPWQQATTPDGRVYYFHVETRETRWDLPPVSSVQSATSNSTSGVDLIIQKARERALKVDKADPPKANLECRTHQQLVDAIRAIVSAETAALKGPTSIPESTQGKLVHSISTKEWSTGAITTPNSQSVYVLDQKRRTRIENFVREYLLQKK